MILLVVLNFHSDFGDRLGVQDGKYYYEVHRIVRNLLCFFFVCLVLFLIHIHVLALKLDCIICPAWGIRYLDTMK